jgi:ketosteroid isomerase-like protein
MSQENVEIVRRAFNAALSRPPDWPTVNELFDPRHELIQLSDFVEGAYVGAKGFREWQAAADQAGEWRAEIGELRALPDGRVALQFVFRLTGGRSGAETERRMGMVVSIRHGKVQRTETFSRWDEALKAVGLEE